MNGLTLRISRGGGKKSKNSLGFTPVVMPTSSSETFGKNKSVINAFLGSSTADEQLSALKNILDTAKDDCDENTIKFLVAVFLLADAKHPVKCFLTRHITKNIILHQAFATSLAIQINLLALNTQAVYKEYVDVVSKIAACIENFPAGADAVKATEMPVAVYMKSCLECCVRTLRDQKTLSPTEKNEIFNLAHLALRLLLYIVQKISPGNTSILTSMFNDVRAFIQDLVFDEDVPMDTKSVCGILYLSMHILENGQDSWIDILNPKENNEALEHLLSIEAGQLALNSAIATVVSMDRLQCGITDGESPVITLTWKIVAIGERSSSESVIVLGVTRTLVQISKSLDKSPDIALGMRLVDVLLRFIWSHLEHYMDSVRHLTAQALSNVVKYCAKLQREGNEKALNKLFSALSSLERTRKSYYVTATSLTAELGAVRVTERVPGILSDVLDVLDVHAVQASATIMLETLLQKHVTETDAETIYEEWIRPILSYVANVPLDSSTLNLLENLLARAVKMDDNIINYIVPHIKQTEHSKPQDLKCILMLLSVASKSGVTGKLASSSEPSGAEWKGVIGYDVLEAAAVDSVDEIRILSLSLVVESPKSTEMFSEGDLQFILCYLRYNVNAQSPNFRQLTLSLMKKFVKRLEDSYKVLKRQTDLKDDYYLKFLEDLRAQCFGNLIQGANYSRRFVSLQMLAWCEQLQFQGYNRTWKEEYIEKLLLHLEDSYENNKAFALEILKRCPVELLKVKKYSMSLEIDDILRQASCLKPTECISAAYKLNLLMIKLPDHVLQEETIDSAEPVTYALLQRLQVALHGELAVCEGSIVSGATRAPMYGILHCMGHLITRVDVSAVSDDDRWTALIDDVISTCVRVSAAVACIVNNSSPEGHLPMDMTGVIVSDHGNSSGVTLEDGRQVTAQMVLLCAWRSVKEVSLLLGEISSRLSIAGEGRERGTLSHRQLELVGEHFTRLLAETKHRGAFEQAYVGFTKLLARLWRCRSPALHELPRTWLTELMAAIASGERQGSLCATRRSAGLPFMIQALVTTELQVQGNPKCFHECMSSLLRLARTSGPEAHVETRTHSINILRALFRNAALDESVAGYVGAGLLAALAGFEGGTWMERNSSTLLFSALMVRIFGVQRSRDADQLCVRNRMTGRIFFLRYPSIYDYMLEKLKEVSSNEDSATLRPSLYPILLLLARLYPSSLEGTVSNLKLVAYIPHVLACAKSSVLKTRQLAAKAMVPLISPEQYVPHLEAMLKLICDKTIKRNYCHGILLQLLRLLDAKPSNLIIFDEAKYRLRNLIEDTFWVLQQAIGRTPCFLLADEYLKVFNLLAWRFPYLITEKMFNKMETCLQELLDHSVPIITSGRDVCLANALYLYLIILSKHYKRGENVCELICKSLKHDSYEVILAAVNYLLILHESLDIDGCKFQEHASSSTKAYTSYTLNNLRGNDSYIHLLCNILRNNKYQECIQKTLRVLTLDKDTERYIVEVKLDSTNKEINDEVVFNTLFDCIKSEHENLTHIYLYSLTNFVTKKLKDSSISDGKILDVMRVIFACSSSDNSENTRSVVVSFLERNCEELMKLNFDGLNDEEKFEFKATITATIVTVLEDDDAALRQRTSDVVRRMSPGTNPGVVSNKAAEQLLELLARGDDSAAVLSLLALLDFRSEVCMTDDVGEECRVFDQNERYNIFLEETIWTRECADRIIQKYKKPNTDILKFVQSHINHSAYRKTFEKLCNTNIYLFEKMLENNETRILKNDAINPKISLFIDKLCK